MAYVEVGNGVHIELMQPLSEHSPVGKYLKRNPRGGMHHLAFAVDDCAHAVSLVEGKGADIVSKPGAKNVHGENIAFISPADFLGVLVELEEKKGGKV